MIPLLRFSRGQLLSRGQRLDTEDLQWVLGRVIKINTIQKERERDFYVCERRNDGGFQVDTIN